MTRIKNDNETEMTGPAEVAVQSSELEAPDSALTSGEIHIPSEDPEARFDYLREAAGLPLEEPKARPAARHDEDRSKDLRQEEALNAAEANNVNLQRSMATATAIAGGPVTPGVATVLAGIHRVTRFDQTRREDLEYEIEHQNREKMLRDGETSEQDDLEFIDPVILAQLQEETKTMGGARQGSRDENSAEQQAETVLEGPVTSLSSTEVGLAVSGLAREHALDNELRNSQERRAEEFDNLLEQLEAESLLSQTEIKELQTFYFSEFQRFTAERLTAISHCQDQLQQLAVQHGAPAGEPQEAERLAVRDVILRLMEEYPLADEERTALLLAYRDARRQAPGDQQS